MPITMENPPAPEVLLKTIFCRCTKDCMIGKCGCRKAMLSCSAACLHCQGKCLNSIPVEDEDDEEQEAPTTTDKDAMDEQPGPSNSKKMKI